MSTQTIEAKQSPRLENGVWKWYEGDSFTLIFLIQLKDSDGEPITEVEFDPDVAGSAMSFQFYDKKKNLKKEFVFGKNTIHGKTGTISASLSEKSGYTTYYEFQLPFSLETSKLFPIGEYTFCATYYGAEITTVFGRGEVVVENCKD